MRSHFDVTVQRPLETMVLVGKTPRAPRRRVTRLNVERHVDGVKGSYSLVLIPYTRQEMYSRRTNKTRKAAPLLPDVVVKPNDEFSWVYDTRPVKLPWDPRGHLQFVRADRLEPAQEASPWAG